MLRSLFIGLSVLFPFWAANAACPTTGVHLQVLGSGGPDLATNRAASSYLIWIEGKARAMVDAGSNSALRFGESGAHLKDLDFIALTRLRSEHTAALPTLIRAAQYGSRKKPLPIFGPDGNTFMPSTVAFIRTLFDQKRGVWRDLGEVLSPLGRHGYRLQPHDIRTSIKKGKPQLKNIETTNPVFVNSSMRLSAAPVIHGNAPTLAWRLQTMGKSVVFAGDADSSSDKLPELARGANTLVVHLLPDALSSPDRQDYLRSANTAGKMAKAAGAQRLVISQRLQTSLGQEQKLLAAIRKSFSNEVNFADDLSCYGL